VAELTLAEVDLLAAEAHTGQVDKGGLPYVEHVRAVSRGLAPFGTGLQMAGLLHDAVEDTSLTGRRLLDAGIPASVVATVLRVSNRPGVDYQDMITDIVTDHAATLLKISDNAHNSRSDRAGMLPREQRRRLQTKYASARRVLWPAAARDDVAAILRIVNPELLAEL
jgi:(p)ppGpp synthase/HD superfamily hydrolase